ncbi:MAG: DUF3500 domain-containing protein [Verrucomicrobiales bacterium]
MSILLPPSHQHPLSRRGVIRALGATAALAAWPGLRAASGGAAPSKESLPVQFYKSLTETQRGKICLPLDHPKRAFVSSWWCICPEQRLHTFYTPEQQDLVKQIFESLHHPDHREKMTWQVQKDLMGNIKNTPSVGFFGTPADPDFEFLYTGHHVTRRSHALTDLGQGFGGWPIFYGNFAKAFRETKDHEGNPFWHQGLLFNEFYSALDGKQQEKALVGREPRKENPATVIEKRTTDLPGLCGADLSKDQQAKLLDTMRRMLGCFREEMSPPPSRPWRTPRWSTGSLSPVTAGPSTSATTRSGTPGRSKARKWCGISAACPTSTAISTSRPDPGAPRVTDPARAADGRSGTEERHGGEIPPAFGKSVRSGDAGEQSITLPPLAQKSW